MKKVDPQSNPIFISEFAIPAIHDLEQGQGLFCTVQALGEVAPMMLLRLSADQTKHFGIGPKNFPCNRNLRYLDY